jgi:hypothetical protein
VLASLTVRVWERGSAPSRNSVERKADRFGIRHVEWSADRSRVQLVGTGARVDMWVDVREVHVTGDIPALAGLLSGPLTLGVRQILDWAFPKRLR